MKHSIDPYFVKHFHNYILNRFQELEKFFKPAILFITYLFFTATANAQVVSVTGNTNTTPALATTYTSLLNAVTAVNSVTAISGPVTIKLNIGNPQTAPAGGYSITVTPAGISSANKIVFDGSGNTITASPALTAGSLNDAIFKLIGADFITIQNFTMQENSSNIIDVEASNNMTEFGVALFYATLSNGSQNNTIQNNTISLNRLYRNTFGIYGNTRHSSTSMTTTLEATSAGGSNSNNKIYSNSISNVDYGIVLIGAGITISAIDVGNDIGGSSVLTGNSFSNWGGLGTLTLYVSLTTGCYGIFTNQQINDNISNNTLSSATLATGTNLLGGILKTYGIATPTVVTTTTINNNSVSLINSGATAEMLGISVQQTPVSNHVNSTINITNNKIINCSIFAGATTATFSGFITTVSPGTLTIDNNTIRGISTNAQAGHFMCFQQHTNKVVSALNFTNNKIGDATAGAVTFTNSFNSGHVNGIIVFDDGASTSCITTITGNDFRGIKRTFQGSGSNVLIANFGVSFSQNISNNTFTNLSDNTTGSVIFLADPVGLVFNGSKNINNNSIVGTYSKTGSGSSVVFYDDYEPGSISVNGSVSNANNNNFSNITLTGATTLLGWNNKDGLSSTNGPTKTFTGNTFSNIVGGSGNTNIIVFAKGGATSTISNNTITNISASGLINCILAGVENKTVTISQNTIKSVNSSGAALVAGINIDTGTTTNILKNSICDLSNTNPNGFVDGIYVRKGTTTNIINNRIGDLRTPSANNQYSIKGIEITDPVNVNAYYNTVNLNASSSGTNFGSAAFYSGTNTNLILRNNIFVNNSVAKGVGLSTAYTRSNTSLANYGATSNRNLFFAPVIFSDGVNNDFTLATYKARVSPRDVNSISENPPFLSTTCGNSNFLKINTTTLTAIEGGGSPITGTTDDFEGDPRNGSKPDIGADEFCTLPSFNSPTKTNSTCGAANGSITANLVNGLTPYTFLWSNGKITQTVSGLPPGNYNVTVTTAGGCSSNSGVYTITTSAPVDDGNFCTYDVCNSTTGQTYHVPVNPDDGNPCTLDGCETSSGVSHTPVACGVSLHSNILLEGYYLGSGQMNNPLFNNQLSLDPTDADFITINVMSPTFPYSLIESQTGRLKTNGEVTVTFYSPGVVANNNYYLKISHRNHVTTWSNGPVMFSSNTTYTFSDAANKALGDNQTPAHSTPGDPSSADGFGYSFYVGDIANGSLPDNCMQDGSVDATDFLDLDPHVQNGDAGYLCSDLNGDGSVDATDYLWLDPNVQNGVSSVEP